MVRDPFARDGSPDLQVVLDALDDEGCRRIIEALSEPMTAKELSETIDMPLSTTYRKLDRLTEASLLEERTLLQQDGHHTTEYTLAFESVVIELDEERKLDVEVSQPPESTEERLASLWEEVRKET